MNHPFRLTVPPPYVEPIGVDEPLGKNDEHTLFGKVWRHWVHLDVPMLCIYRDFFAWKIEPIEDEE